MSLSNHKNPWLRNWVPQTSPPPYSGRNKTEHNIYISQAFNNISAVGANVQADEISSPRDVEETNLKPHSWLKSQHSFVRKYSKKVHLLWNWSRKLGPFQSSSQMALWSVAADFFINIGKFPNLWIRGDPRCNWTSSFAYRRIQAFIHLAICIDHLLGLCHARHYAPSTEMHNPLLAGKPVFSVVLGEGLQKCSQSSKGRVTRLVRDETKGGKR